MFYSAVLFSISFCVYRACFTHLFFRQIELQSMFMVLWSIVPLWIIKKIMHAYIVILSGSILNVSTVYLNDIWHLIGRYQSKPVLGGHPVLSGHYSIPRECPLNTGFTVVEIMVMPLNDWNPESKFHFQTLESGIRNPQRRIQNLRILYYRKIPKISPGAYIFLRLFLRGLFLEGRIFGKADLRREICVSQPIGLALQLEVNYCFSFVLLCIWGQFSKYKRPGGLYLEGRFNGGFFALLV